MDYIYWERLFNQLLLVILTLHNRPYCLLGYLGLEERWKRLLAFWEKLPPSKLTLRWGSAGNTHFNFVFST